MGISSPQWTPEPATHFSPTIRLHHRLTFPRIPKFKPPSVTGSLGFLQLRSRVLSADDVATLDAWARIVQLAAHGVPNQEIA
jgi:hypothetical protein